MEVEVTGTSTISGSSNKVSFHSSMLVSGDGSDGVDSNDNPCIQQQILNTFATFMKSITPIPNCDNIADVPDRKSILIPVTTAVDQLEISLRHQCLQRYQQLQLQLRQTQDRTQVLESSMDVDNNTNHTLNFEANELVDQILEFWYEAIQSTYWLIRNIDIDCVDLDNTVTTPPRLVTSDQACIQQKLSLLLQPPLSSTSSNKDGNVYKNQFQSLRESQNYIPVLSHLRKIPILLLEDITDLLSIEDAYQFWSRTLLVKVQQPLMAQATCLKHNTSLSYESVYDLFFSDILWYTTSRSSASTTTNTTNSSWLLFLKVTNKFIRRLQPLGTSQIQVRSLATNNEINSGCTTTASIVISELVQLLSAIYPLTEKSATRVWGSYNENKSGTILESSQQYVLNNHTTDSNKTSINDASLTAIQSTETKSVISTPISKDKQPYDIYTTFWKIQDDFRHPNVISVYDFIHRLECILRIFESNPPKSTLTNVPNQSSTGTTKLSQLQNDMIRWILMNPFITNSRILNIQIQDETIRNIITIQIYIVLHHLMIQVPSLRTQLLPNLHTLGTLTNSQNPTSSFRNSLVKRVLYIINNSEMDWRLWKQNKCVPDIEQARKRPHSFTVTPTISRKRKRSYNEMNHNKKNTEVGWCMDEKNLIGVATRMRTKFVPNIQEHCQEYVDALDPDAGIEDEYHPKHDTIFTWQALRLFAFNDSTETTSQGENNGNNDVDVDNDDDDDFLCNFQYLLPNGDLENVVRRNYDKLYHIQIPGTGPPPYVYKPEGQEKDNDDQNMDGLETTTVEIEMDTNTSIEQSEIIEQDNTAKNVRTIDVASNTNEVSAMIENGKTQEKNLTLEINREHKVSSSIGTGNSSETVTTMKATVPSEGNPISTNGNRNEGNVLTNQHVDGKKPTGVTSKQGKTLSENTSNGNQHSSVIKAQPHVIRGEKDKNNQPRSNQPTGPLPSQQNVATRDVNLERHHDTYSRNDGYNNSSRSQHPMEPAGRSTRADVNMNDLSSVPHGRNRDDQHRAISRDDQHRRLGGVTTDSSHPNDAARWDGNEWRNEHRSSAGIPDYYHGRGGASSYSNADRGRDSGRGNINSSSGGGSANSGRSRSTGTGSGWSRDNSGGSRR
jgi:hypothetical protein